MALIIKVSVVVIKRKIKDLKTIKMKIQIDTDKKVLRLESDINLGEFMKKVKVLFPDDGWKDYKLETNVEIQWQNPIYIDRWVQPYYPWWPTVTPTITCGDTAGVLTTGSTYCVEV